MKIALISGKGYQAGEVKSNQFIFEELTSWLIGQANTL